MVGAGDIVGVVFSELMKDLCRYLGIEQDPGRIGMVGLEDTQAIGNERRLCNG